ncbi:hypothetical protein AGMMS50249_2870 [candidate division SR1 bacterium]|nr:hypothetical protein AGMMS50249_2870 [candidate division SR1 bacterium]
MMKIIYIKQYNKKGENMKKILNLLFLLKQSPLERKVKKTRKEFELLDKKLEKLDKRVVELIKYRNRIVKTSIKKRKELTKLGEELEEQIINEFY